MLNEEAVRKAMRVGLALDAKIPDVAYFDRKHYFYPDLPKGYQITQYKNPVVEHGTFTFDVPSNPPERRRLSVHIERAHMEEDAAKNLHQGASKSTYVDYNRAGTPLLEIVTGPDFRSPQEAKAFLQELQAMLRAIGASDADMEKGMMRCDANISLFAGTPEEALHIKNLNPKTEVKNLNSFKSIERALQYEIERQAKLINEGIIPHTTTRGWNDQSEETVEQRIKESEADYRYFPEPDLPPLPLVLWREEERAQMPEQPSAKRERLQREFGLSETDAANIVARDWVSFLEETMSELAAWMEASDDSGKDGLTLFEERRSRIGKLAGNWINNKLAELLAVRNIETPHRLIDPENMAEFLLLLEKGSINSTNAIKLLSLMIDTKGDPSNLVEQHNLAQIEDSGFLKTIVEEVIAKNPEQAAQVRAGKIPVLKWFVGQVMKISAGKANPASAEEELKKQLN